MLASFRPGRWALLIVPLLIVLGAACGRDDEPEWVSDLTDPQLQWCAADASDAGMSEAQARAECELPWKYAGLAPATLGMSVDYGEMGSAEVENKSRVEITLNPDGTAEAVMTYDPTGNQGFFVGGCLPSTVGGFNPGAGTVSSGPLPTQLVTRWTGTHQAGTLTLDSYAEYLVSGANIGIGETTVTSALTYDRDEITGTASSTSVNDPIGCGNSTYTETHDFTGIPRIR